MENDFLSHISQYLIKMDLAETFQIFTFWLKLSLESLKPQRRISEKVMNEWVLDYYGNATVTQHCNVSRHRRLSCQI
jgi:hypothetical protein